MGIPNRMVKYQSNNNLAAQIWNELVQRIPNDLKKVSTCYNNQ